MIEDIEGATSEPTRRRHVVALTSAIASISMTLLVALVVIPSGEGTTRQPVPASPNAVPATVTFISNPISQLRLDLTRDSLCTDGTRLIPPYFISVDGSTGDLFAVRSVGGATRAVPVHLVADTRTSWFRVTCATPDGGSDH